MPIRFTVYLFYLGTFITSFGSLLLVMAIPAFFLREGYTAEIIGLAIGVHRFSGIAASAWFGPVIDFYNAKKVIYLTELFAGLASVGLFVTWYFKEDFGPLYFMLFIGLRAFSVGVQSSSRNRLIKLISKKNDKQEASFTIWLNKVTQGAHALSAIVALPLVASGNLYYAIIIDCTTFLIGGLTAMQLPDVDGEDRSKVHKLNILKAVKELIRIHKLTFIKDQLLALAVSGTILLMVKLSAGDSKEVIYFNLIFGICIWLSSIFVHNQYFRQRDIVYWVVLLLGFVSLYLTVGSQFKFVSYFIAYMSYWILFHKYTVEIQTKTPQTSIGAVSAARGFAMAITLSLGELLGGYVSRIIDLGNELLLRGALCALCIVLLFILRYAPKKTEI